MDAQGLVNKLSASLLNPFLGLLAAIGLAFFFWGVAEMIMGRSSGDSGKFSQGRLHLITGIVGLTIIATAWALVRTTCQTVNEFGASVPCSQLIQQQ